MRLVQMGTITLPNGESIIGMAIEASKEELQSVGNMLYDDVVVVSLNKGYQCPSSETNKDECSKT